MALVSLRKVNELYNLEIVPGTHYRNAYYTGYFVLLGISERGLEFDHFDHGEPPVRAFFSEFVSKDWSVR